VFSLGERGGGGAQKSRRGNLLTGGLKRSSCSGKELREDDVVTQTHEEWNNSFILPKKRQEGNGERELKNTREKIPVPRAEEGVLHEFPTIPGQLHPPEPQVAKRRQDTTSGEESVPRKPSRHRKSRRTRCTTPSSLGDNNKKRESFRFSKTGGASPLPREKRRPGDRPGAEDWID